VLDVLAEGYPEMPVLTASDPPAHTRLRRLVARAFTPRRSAELEPRVRVLADKLVDGFAADGRVDAIARFGWPLPLQVIGELLDVPRADLDALHRWSRDWLLLLQGDGPHDEQLERARSVVAMQRHVRELLERRARSPRDDLLSALVQPAGGEALSRSEAVGVAFTLLVAGHLTVTRAIGSGLVLVLGHPERQEALLRDPAAAVEEILRLEPPAQGLFRTATRDAQIAGVSIPAGARLMVHYGSANRDAAVFADADVFAPGRSDGDRHLAFGKGLHFCLGAPLARLELRIALPLLLERLPGLRLGPETERESDPIFFARGFTRLIVEWNRPRS
jgi:cytochrome P450